jgi:hypothetical protein
MSTVAHIHLLGEISSAGIFIFDPLTDDVVPFKLTAAAVNELETTRPITHVPTPEETRLAFQMLIDAGCTFPNFQDPAPEYDPGTPIPERFDDDGYPIEGCTGGATGIDEWYDDEDGGDICPLCDIELDSPISAFHRECYFDLGLCPFCTYDANDPDGDDDKGRDEE